MIQKHPKTIIKPVSEWRKGILSPICRKGQEKSDWDAFIDRLPERSLRMISMGEDRCILPIGANPNEYKRMQVMVGDSVKNLGMHKISYLVFVGDIKEGNVICHKCNIKACANPHHLFEGSLSDNTKDAYESGLLGNMQQKGGKVTAKQVKVIRYRLLQGVSRRVLANEFNLNESAITEIEKRNTWKNVPDRKWWELWIR